MQRVANKQTHRQHTDKHTDKQSASLNPALLSEMSAGQLIQLNLYMIWLKRGDHAIKLFVWANWGHYMGLSLSTAMQAENFYKFIIWKPIGPLYSHTGGPRSVVGPVNHLVESRLSRCIDTL